MDSVGRILVVEDSPPNRMILCHLLQKLGFEVFEASDGQEAFAWLSAHPVDLILSDQMMPRMDGIQLLKALREKGAHTSTPFYLVTALEEKASVEDSKGLGCEGVLIKPLSIMDLRKSLIKFFPNMRELKKAG